MQPLTTNDDLSLVVYGAAQGNQGKQAHWQNHKRFYRETSLKWYLQYGENCSKLGAFKI